MSTAPDDEGVPIVLAGAAGEGEQTLFEVIRDGLRMGPMRLAPGLRTFPDSEDGEQQALHVACELLEEEGKIRRVTDEADVVVWEAVP